VHPQLLIVVEAFILLQPQSLMFTQSVAEHMHAAADSWQRHQVAMEACLQQHLQVTITSAGTQRHACTLSLTLCCRRLTALTDCIDQYVQQQPAFMRLRPLEAVGRPHQPSLVLSMAKVTSLTSHLLLALQTSCSGALPGSDLDQTFFSQEDHCACPVSMLETQLHNSRSHLHC